MTKTSILFWFQWWISVSLPLGELVVYSPLSKLAPFFTHIQILLFGESTTAGMWGSQRLASSLPFYISNTGCNSVSKTKALTSKHFELPKGATEQNCVTSKDLCESLKLTLTTLLTRYH